MGVRDLVVAMKNAWTGKVAGAPHFAPGFWASSQMGQAYTSNVALRPGQFHTWVHAACQAIIQPAIDLPVVLYQKSNEEDLIEEHPVLDLMRKPNPFLSGTNFYELILWNLLLTTLRTPGGQAFIVGEKPTNFRKGEIPKELWVFSDNVMTPILDSQNILVGWKLGVNGLHSSTQMMELDLDQVIRINLLNPYNQLQGLSPLAAAMVQVDQDAKAMEFNSRFLENNASPGGMVSLDGAPPSKEIWDSIKTDFLQKHGGSQNAGKTLFMPWMVKFEQFASSHQDFAYMEQLAWNRDSILAAYRVNKWSVGLSEDLNYATAKEAKRQLYENAIKPILRVMFNELNESWIRYIEKRTLRIKPDFSEVAALKEDRSQQVKDAQGLVDMRVPPAAAFEFVGLDIDTEPFPWLKEDSSAMASLNTQLEADATAREETAAREAEALANAPKPPAGQPKPGDKPPPKKAVIITKDERDNLSKFYIDKVFSPGEKEMLPVVNRFFSSQRNSALDLADEVLRGKTPADLKPSLFLLPKDEQDTRIMKAFQPLYLVQVKRTLRQLAGTLPKKSLDLDSTEEEIREFLKTRLLSLSQINATTFDGVEKALAEVIQQGVTDKLTMAELGKSIRDEIYEVYQGRIRTASTIARTETATITSSTRFEVFKSADIEKQEWLTAHDGRVRESHVAEDGHIVPVGQLFPETHLHYPSDPSGPAEEVINCRCICLPVEEG